MQRKQKLLGARSQQQRKGRCSPAKISDRASLNEDVDDDPQFSPEWIRELRRRVKDSRDPVRYMLVSEFTRKFILYYDIASDTFVMNDASRGTLFKRREVAESVKTHLGKGVALVKFTVKGDRLKRLSPFRVMRLRSRSASRIRRRTGHAQTELFGSKPTGYQGIAKRIDPKGVTPECFNRGSSSGFAWIPDRSIRE